MISSATSHVITTELVVGSFAMAGLCFLLHALCRYELIKSKNMVSITDNVAHFAHLGGMLFGYLLIRYWRKNSQHFY